MSKERAVNFPSNAPYGTTHFEKGRTWEYVEPGMWKSIGGSGGGGDGSSPGGPVEWDDVLNKPKPITDLAGDYHPQKVSILSGGNY